MKIVLMPEVGILFLILVILDKKNAKAFGLNARGGHFVFNTHTGVRPIFFPLSCLNARGGHFVFNTGIGLREGGSAYYTS